MLQRVRQRSNLTENKKDPWCLNPSFRERLEEVAKDPDVRTGRRKRTTRDTTDARGENSTRRKNRQQCLACGDRRLVDSKRQRRFDRRAGPPVEIVDNKPENQPRQLLVISTSTGQRGRGTNNDDGRGD